MYIFSLKILRKIYVKFVGVKDSMPIFEQDPDIAADLIYNELLSKKPSMIARFGAFELATVVNYIGVKNKNKNFLKYIKGEEPNWTWNLKLLKYMQNNAGFFPPTLENIEKFCELTLEDKKYVDILGSWLSDERYVDEGMDVSKIRILFLEPFWSKKPWSRVLKGKKVLVVHPFAETILKQYEKKEKLFDNKDILPEFESITTIKAVQSLGNGDDRFKDWFEALEYMKEEIDKVDYDICLIGAGAYGFALAAHVKRKGKKSVHMGGSLQLLFGIRGKRWEDSNYGVTKKGVIKKGSYINMMNKYWVRPDESEMPISAQEVEDACYW